MPVGGAPERAQGLGRVRGQGVEGGKEKGRFIYVKGLLGLFAKLGLFGLLGLS